MKIDYKVVDAFNDVPLRGNPVAVFFLEQLVSKELMQAIANEVHLSESVFLIKSGNSDGVTARIFTPVNELPFAGHPLIGTTRALLDRDDIDESVIHTEYCACKVWRTKSDSSNVNMQIPIPKVVSFSQEKEFIQVFENVEVVNKPVLYDAGARHLLVQIKDKQTLFSLDPYLFNFNFLRNMAVNCFCIDGEEIINRMFSPAYGVLEDPGTGSAACPLAINAVKQKLIKDNRNIIIKQGHKTNKLCTMRVHLPDLIDSASKAILSGNTVEVAEGIMNVGELGD